MKLDRSSTDANHWAKAFVQSMKENNLKLEDIDEGLMIGWFANYWAAVNDPLVKKIDEIISIVQNS